MKKFFLKLNNHDIIYFIVLVIICIWILTEINSNVILLEGVGDDADNLRVLRVHRNDDPNSSFTSHSNVAVKVVGEDNRVYWVFIPKLSKSYWVWVNTRNNLGVMFNTLDPRSVSVNSASWGYLWMLNYYDISSHFSLPVNDIVHTEHLRGMVNYSAEKGNESLWKFLQSLNPNVPITQSDLSADPNIQEYKKWKHCNLKCSSKILSQIPNSVFTRDSLNEAYPKGDSSVNVDLD